MYPCHFFYHHYSNIFAYLSADPPKIASSPENRNEIKSQSNTIQTTVGGAITVLSGVQLVVNCPAKGMPTPKISWKRINAYHDIDPRVGLTADHSLKINDITADDAGTYVCIAKNNAGLDKSTIEVVVAGKELSAVARYSNVYDVFFKHDRFLWFYILERLITHHCDNKFECSVDVLEAPKYSDQRAQHPPNSAVKDIVVSNGKGVTLVCAINGSPLPLIKWYKEGNEITVDGVKYYTQGEELFIKSATERDSGSYHCVAENVAGRNIANFNLLVGGINFVSAILILINI